VLLLASACEVTERHHCTHCARRAQPVGPDVPDGFRCLLAAVVAVCSSHSLHATHCRSVNGSCALCRDHPPTFVCVHFFFHLSLTHIRPLALLLPQMFVDPELLEELSKDQKEILFHKIREEQVRRHACLHLVVYA
jgi:hypothetical protein